MQKQVGLRSEIQKALRPITVGVVDVVVDLCESESWVRLSLSPAGWGQSRPVLAAGDFVVHVMGFRVVGMGLVTNVFRTVGVAVHADASIWPLDKEVSSKSRSVMRKILSQRCLVNDRVALETRYHDMPYAGTWSSLSDDDAFGVLEAVWRDLPGSLLNALGDRAAGA